ncbi:hypothetical protein EBR03_01580 [bacterium]|nr:hypothetical protein [bacterium]NBX83274.1 hypothetical protein [bacterium]
MKRPFFLIALFFLSSSSLIAQDFHCADDQLQVFSGAWEGSPDFMTLHFEGPRAGSIFSDLGAPQAQYYLVILRHEWCQHLQDALICETPKSALAEIHSGVSSGVITHKNTLRYFLMILNYKSTGWGFLKVRGQRLDNQPPITFHTEFPEASCQANRI